jgi:hypothetical protein
MNEIRGTGKKVRIVLIVTSFLMVVSGLSLFPIVGEENSEIQIEEEIAENRYETKIPVMVPINECNYDMGYTVENNAPIESEKNQVNIPPVADAGEDDQIYEDEPHQFYITNSPEPLKITTDKYTYYQGELVHITITGDRVGPSSDFNRGYLIKDEFGHWVRDPPQIHTTDVHHRSGPDNYTWYQKYEILNEYDIFGNYQIHYPNNGEQVSTGKYYIYPYPGNCEPAEIEIIERSELIIEKEKISGPDEILTHTYHEWELKITVSGASPTKSYENVVVYDVLPAELELLEYELSQGTLTVTKKGKGKMGSTHLTWHVGDLYNEAELILKIATRKNPAGKQEFTSPGKYLLNEGAIAKGTDSSTGKNLIAGPTEPIYITVLENQNHNNKKPHH